MQLRQPLHFGLVFDSCESCISRHHPSRVVFDWQERERKLRKGDGISRLDVGCVKHESGDPGGGVDGELVIDTDSIEPVGFLVPFSDVQ
jgi:hypothetical protein